MPRAGRQTRDLGKFAEMFKAARLEREISQQEVATALGVMQSMVSAYEKGTTEPERETVFAAEELLDLPAGTLSSLLGYGPPVVTKSRGGRKVTPITSTRQAILTDPALDKKAKEALLASYRAFAGRSSACVTGDREAA